MTDEVVLVVNGRRYAGVKSVRVTHSIESFAGSFAFDVSDRWSDADPWPIVEDDACSVEIGGETVIDGWIKGRKLSASKDSRSLTYTGRDRAADLVDCSVLLADASTKGNKWTYRNIDIAHFVTEIAKPHGIKVSVQPGLVLKRDPSLVAHPGETGFEAIKRATASAGVLVVSDGAGGILITRAGTARAAPLTEGVNIETADADFDASERFHRYDVTSQPPGTDEASGDATRVLASATDADVFRANRVLLIRPEKGCDAAEAKRRADWEARIRAAKSASASASVVGWRQPSGALWAVNTITRVTAPRMMGISGDMLISQVERSVSNSGGKITQLSLVRPDAFTPEPQLAVVSGEALWKEITPDKAKR